MFGTNSRRQFAGATKLGKHAILMAADLIATAGSAASVAGELTQRSIDQRARLRSRLLFSGP
jgi:hypothetical protein